jgi:hypothetical protein
MHFVVEVVKESGDGPLLFVFAEVVGVSRDAGLHGERMPAKAVGFCELAEEFPGLGAVHRV